MKEFNTTGICVPEKHYMVDISKRVEEIRAMIEAGKYFCINRGRQYGKTTTLAMLKKRLSDDYVFISLDFQRLGKASFEKEEIFVSEFCNMLLNRKKAALEIPEEIEKTLQDYAFSDMPAARLGRLFDTLTDWCYISAKPLVLMIDEVDSASDNQVFLDFLAQLREGFISRDRDGIPTFQSVILAGVTDIRHLRSRIRDEDQHKVNSPWNIAADFNVDMSLHKDGIRGMLDEYEHDHHTGMDTDEVAGLIYDYTSGYPFLVSRICQIIDEGKESRRWNRECVDNAVRQLLSEQNTLFDSLTGKIVNNTELKEALYRILMNGEGITYNPYNETVKQMEQYGFIKNEESRVAISNRIFETLLYNLFLSDDELKNNEFRQEGSLGKSLFIKGTELDMPLILERFISTYTQVFGPLEDKFKEKDGRELFLLYLKPIINGTGNFYIEAQTRDMKRTDVVVDYLGHQYVVELKIWRGERYNEEGEKQIRDYLEYFGLDTGYMLSFNFNKNKTPGLTRLDFEGKTLYEAVV